jgi:hypothetical protein
MTVRVAKMNHEIARNANQDGKADRLQAIDAIESRRHFFFESKGFFSLS